METVKEKLAKLIQQVRFVESDCYLMPNTSDSIAEFLIQNGVTIQEWVSVDERFPTEEEISRAPLGTFLVSVFGVVLEATYMNGHFIMGGGRLHSVSHWMPLPQPPKGAQ